MPSSEQPLIYYSSLELENVRCFGERQTLELTDEKGRPAQWTLLLGDNGVGKTTLLQCLAWMKPVPQGNKRGKEEEPPKKIEPFLNGEPDDDVFNSLLRTGPNIESHIKATLIPGQELNSESKGRRQKIETGIWMRGANQRLQERKLTTNKFPRTIGDPLLLEPLMFWYAANRHMGISNLDNDKLADSLASLFSNSTELYDAEERLLQLDYLAVKRKGRHKKRLEQVKQILLTVLPDISAKDDIEILGPRGGEPDEDSGVKFHTPYGSVPLAGLSLGYQTTLAWTVDLAWRLYHLFPESSNPLAEPSIVLIDEIDLHLHPRWQREIMKYLTKNFPRIQFIATAHSPLIVQAAIDANLAVLQKQGDQVKIENRPRFIESWRADQILTSDLFSVPARSPRIERLMDKRDKLLKESRQSPSDKKLLKELEQLEKELDNLPTAERYEDQEAMDIIRRAAALLKQ